MPVKIPYVQCGLCKNGYIKKENGVVECECHKAWVKECMVYIGAEKNNIWTTPEAIDYDPIFDHFGIKDKDEIQKLISYTEHYSDPLFRQTCVYIYGNPNTQKTTIAQWMGLEIFRRGFTAHYERMHNFVNKLVPVGFKDLEVHKKYYDKLMEVDCLILDDAFDKAKVGIQNFHIPYVESFLRDRIETANKGVIFVSSISIEDIKANHFSQSMSDFVGKVTGKHNTLITLTDSTTAIKVTSIFEGMKRG
jgi:hypothetical protein